MKNSWRRKAKIGGKKEEKVLAKTDLKTEGE